MASAKYMNVADFYPNHHNFLLMLESSGWMRVNQQRAVKLGLMGSAAQLTDNRMISSISWKMREFWLEHSRPCVLK